MEVCLLDRPVVPTRPVEDIMAILMDAFAGRRQPSAAFLARYEGCSEEKRTHYSHITQDINKLDSAGKQQALARLDGDSSSLAEYMRAVIVEDNEQGTSHLYSAALRACPIACVQVVRQLVAVRSGISTYPSRVLDGIADSDLTDIVCMVGLCARLTGEVNGRLFDDILCQQRLASLVTEGGWFQLTPSPIYHSEVRLGSLYITAQSAGAKETQTIARLIVSVDSLLKERTPVPADVIAAAAELNIEVDWFNSSKLAFSFNGLWCLVKPSEVAAAATAIRKQEGNPYAYENHWPASAIWANDLSRDELQKGATEIRSMDPDSLEAQEGYVAALNILGRHKWGIKLLAGDVNEGTTDFSIVVLHRLIVMAKCHDADNLFKAIKYLIKHRGANVNAQDDSGYTAATYLIKQSGAAYSDEAVEILQALLDAGADLELPFGSEDPAQRTRTIANEVKEDLPEKVISLIENAIGRPVARSAAAELAVTSS